MSKTHREPLIQRWDTAPLKSESILAPSLVEVGRRPGGHRPVCEGGMKASREETQAPVLVFATGLLCDLRQIQSLSGPAVTPRSKRVWK